MFCQKCGTELPADAAFCVKCGHQLQASTTPHTSNKTLLLAAIAAVLSIGAAVAGFLFKSGDRPKSPNMPPAVAMAAMSSGSPTPSATPSPEIYITSFDCSKATHTDEKLICSNADLASLDRQMAQTYSNAISRSDPRLIPSLRDQQRNWIKNSRKKCIEADCLRTVYKARLGELNTTVKEEISTAKSEPQPQPTNVGDPSLRSPSIFPVVRDTFTIKPGSYIYYPIQFAFPHAVRVLGRFEVQGGMHNDVEVYILDDDGLANFRNGNRTSAYYNSERATVGQIDVTLTSYGGRYYLVFNNSFSVFSNKVIKAFVNSVPLLNPQK